MHDDHDIIKAIRRQPEQGFRQLLQRYQQPVYWYARRMVVAHADAQDVMQETFIRVFRSFGQYDERQPLNAWLFRIATNEALRLLGKRKGLAGLVRIEGCRLQNGGVDVFCPDSVTTYCTRYMLLADSTVMSLRTMSRASFAHEVLPAGRCNLKGILVNSSGGPQLYLRSLDDVE